MDMRTKLFMMIVCVMIALSCDNNQQDPTPSNIDKEVILPEINRIRKPITFNGTFYSITNLGSININYTQGPHSIEFEGDSIMMQYVETKFDSGILTVNLRGENKHDLEWDSKISDVKLHISSPSLMYVAVCGSGDFTSTSKITSEKLHIGTLGSGQIKFDSISCKSLRYEQNGPGNTLFKEVICDNASVLLNSTGLFRMNTDTKSLYASAMGKSDSIEIKCKADMAEIIITGENSAIFDLNVNDLKASVQGTSTLTLKGEATRKKFNRSTRATINSMLK